MKKLICVALALVLAFSAVGALAETTSTFDPTLSNILELSASDWMSSSYSRALLTVLLVLDLGNSGLLTQSRMDMITTTLANSSGFSYVGYVDNMLEIIIFDGRYVSLIVYMPSIGYANFTLLDDDAGNTYSSTESLVKVLLGQLCSEYYKNDVNDIGTAASDLMELTN